MPTPETRQGPTAELPIAAYREAIEAAIRSHPVVVVMGDTGSGKTTQIPRYALGVQPEHAGLIGCTQPRRIAAVSVAERVAEETGTACGTLVGWQHRFARRLSPDTRIKFMTDGVLLAETHADPALRRYGLLMIDEVHERSLNIDLLLGYLRQLLPRRPGLKVVLSSATLDGQRFAAFFDGAPVVEVPGRLHPIEVRHRPSADEDGDLATQVADAVEDLWTERGGDILVFLPGERDIRAAGEALRGRALPSTDVLPLLAGLPPAEQRRVFQLQPGRRRVILSTNVAETSLTLPGIRMVVDSGLARISRYNPRLQVQRLHIEPISRASAEQRKGRCGRLGPGVCLRLYGADELARREAFTEPEIRRSSLGGVILTMAHHGLGRVDEFPFLDPPARTAVREGYRELEELGALEPNGGLTPLGRRLARLPVEPRLARMLFEAADRGALEDALTVVAALATDEPRLRPPEKQEEADRRQARFRNDRSDFAAILLLWRWHRETAAAGSRAALRRACAEHYLSFRRMEEWVDVREQLARLMRATAGAPAHRDAGAGADESLHRSLLAGLLTHIGLRDPERKDYRGPRGLRFTLHPGSGLFRKPPEWVMVAEIVETTQRYGRRAAALNPDWIEPLAGHLCTRHRHSPYWDADAGTARALERVSLFGLPLSDGRRRDYSRIDPAFSHGLMIREGLVGGRLPRSTPEVLRANLDLFETLRAAGRKTRRPVACDDDTFADAYDKRLPPEIVNLPALRAWLRRDPAAAGTLRLAEDDFVPASPSRRDYPDRITLAGRTLRLAYRHAEGTEDDGITCTLTPDDLPVLQRWHSDWLVPGALPAKVAWMLAALPRSVRRAMPAAAVLTPRLLARLQQPDAPLATALTRALQAECGVAPPSGLWDEPRLPDHLRMRFRILDALGNDVFTTRDTGELGTFHEEYLRLAGTSPPEPPSHAPPRDGRPAADGAAPPLQERSGLTAFPEQPLPETVPAGQAGWRIRNVPALCDNGTSVDLRAFASPEAARQAHLGGLRRLYILALGRAFRTLSGEGLPARDLRAACAAIGADAAALRSDAALAALDAVLLGGPEPLPRDAATFHRRLEARRAALSRCARTQYRAASAAVVLAADTERELAAGLLPDECVLDLHEQLGWLVFPGFCRSVPPPRLQHYGRYLEAVRIRIERARQSPDRDLRRLRQLQPYWKRVAATAGRTDLTPDQRERLDAHRWAVEEFRVSLFAQELRTPEPVSPERLDREWSAIGLASG